MEAIVMFEQNNKENIPPIHTKENNPIPAIASSFKKSIHKRRLRTRKPLSDITNIICNNSFSSSVSVSTYSNSWKRSPAVVQNTLQRVCSKSLRMGFR
ncbi:hypothetical protein O6P43_028880 [Quillaja saponaria]|uniref:Uncharacterized protein n=1 Tax=Quillaja saponaria TaxID=32244 RepID=A0AAD7PAT7_QUISA|nr:hypothetical protein O6P43_028880 [Quillaja saponaria]